MKIRFLSYSVLLCTLQLNFAVDVMGQCNPSIPSNAVVVKTMTKNAGGPNTWICTGGGDTTNSIGNTFYLEVGGFLNGTNGINNTVYLPKGATLTYNGSAQSNTVYFVDSADILPAAFTSYNLQLHQCTSIDYDYSNAPASGCIQTTNVSFIAHQNGGAEVYPNPSGGKFAIRLIALNAANPLKMTISNVLGKTIRRYDFPATVSETAIDISNESPGIYFLEISQPGYTSVKKLVKT